MFVINIKYEANTYTYILNPKYMYNIDNFNKIKKENKVIDKFTGTITGYGPDCYGCIGITASGYDVRNTIYYNDLIFIGDDESRTGAVNILAAKALYA